MRLAFNQLLRVKVHRYTVEMVLTEYVGATPDQERGMRFGDKMPFVIEVRHAFSDRELAGLASLGDHCDKAFIIDRQLGYMEQAISFYRSSMR